MKLWTVSASEYEVVEVAERTEGRVVALGLKDSSEKRRLRLWFVRRGGGGSCDMPCGPPDMGGPPM